MEAFVSVGAPLWRPQEGNHSWRSDAFYQAFPGRGRCRGEAVTDEGKGSLTGPAERKERADL